MSSELHPEDRRFKALRKFNSEDGHRLAGRRDRMAPMWNDWFPSDSLVDRLARSLAKYHAIDMKEFCESFEFFQRVRKAVRRPVVVDLCGGHGFVGILFAVFERSVNQVVLVDTRRPKSHDQIMTAALEVAPWIAEKMTYVERSIRGYTPPDGAGLIAVHACGGRTDSCFDIAIDRRLPIAVMPCCHAFVKYGGRALPFADVMPPDLAVDIDRSYRLKSAQFNVSWTAIPRVVTPRNRVMIAIPQ
ncbi:MAG: methyltransferase [Myxococcota bacterium]|nr:methyltransferase [Myxococcota bacterium]